MLKTISSQIMKFERIYNGIEESLVDVTKIRKMKDGYLCSVKIYDDDFSSRTVYRDILYPLSITKSL